MPDSVSACRMVHDDMYKIIKYTVQKTMSGELAQRALDWWAGLVEHLFGLPARTPEQEKAVVPAAEDHSERNKVPPLMVVPTSIDQYEQGKSDTCSAASCVQLLIQRPLGSLCQVHLVAWHLVAVPCLVDSSSCSDTLPSELLTLLCKATTKLCCYFAHVLHLLKCIAHNSLAIETQLL